MRESRKIVRRIACLATLAGVIAGCGSGHTATPTGNPPPGGNSPPPAPIIKGIATPNTVSVVTATNAT
jgi:hypothetical protein